MLTLLAIKRKARTAAVGGSACYICRPGSELPKGGSWRSRATRINGMETKKKKKLWTYIQGPFGLHIYTPKVLTFPTRVNELNCSVFGRKGSEAIRTRYTRAMRLVLKSSGTL